MPPFRTLAAIAALSAGALLTPSAQAATASQLDLSTAFDQDCVAPAHVVVQGNCDGGLNYTSFVAESFPAGPVKVRGVSFTIGGGSNQAASGNGKVIKVSGVGSGQGYLHVLLTGVNIPSGTKGGLVTITYTDGSSTKSDLSTPDWGHQPGQAVLQPSAQNPFQVSGVNSSTRNLFLDSIIVDRKKVVASVTLPVNVAELRVFAMTLSPAPAQASGPVFH